jgi:hypothetical protein
MARSLFRPKTNHTCPQKPSPSRETVPLKQSITFPTLKKISATHVIKLGFAPKAYPPGQHRKTSTVNDKMYCLCD